MIVHYMTMGGVIS